MSVLVWGTFCNPVPHSGLSFYCQGSPACSVFDTLSAVTCTNQTTRLYCTNGQTCGNANLTNDIYITFPPNGRTAILYDTVTRHGYSFNQTTAVAAAAASKRSVEDAVSDPLEGRATPPTVAQQVYTQFQNIFGEAAGPGHELAASLASRLFQLNAGAGTAAIQQNDITNAVSVAVQSATNNVVSYAKQCKEESGVEAEIVSVNNASIAGITNAIPQNTFQTWLLTASISHIIANIALVSEFDIAAKVLAQSSSLACSSATSSTIRSSTTTSKPLPTSTTSTSTLKPTSTSSIKSTSTSSSKSTSISSLKSTSTSSTKSTSTSSTKSSTSSTKSTSTATTKSSSSLATTSKSSAKTTTTTTTITTTSSASSTTISDPGVSMSVFTPVACPSATPTGQVYYQTNQTQNDALGGSFIVYNGSIAKVQDISVAAANASTAVYSFPDHTNFYTFSLTFDDGEGIIYTADSNSITYISPGCADAQTFYDTSDDDTPSKAKTRLRSRDDASGVTVQISVVDNCNQPVTSGFQLQLDCASVMYPQQNAASGPVVSPPNYESFVGDGTGTYSATCSLGDLNNLNTAYNACFGEEKQVQAEIDEMCGNVKTDTEKAKEETSKILEQVDILQQDAVLAKKFAPLISAAAKLSSAIAKADPVFAFWDQICDDRYGLESPYVKAQMDAEDCGYPAALSLGIEGLDGSGQPFTSALGTVSATPTTITLSGTTTTNPTGTVSWADNLSTGTPEQAVGQADFCCTGSCYDGTRIGIPGLCLGWLDVCLDVTPQPACATNQVLTGAVANGLNAGQGACWYFDECEWTLNNWTWTCSDCPAGYTAVSQGACYPVQGNYNLPCVGCDDPSDVLSGDPVNGYSCAKQCSSTGG